MKSLYKKDCRVFRRGDIGGLYEFSVFFFVLVEYRMGVEYFLDRKNINLCL